MWFKYLKFYRIRMTPWESHQARKSAATICVLSIVCIHFILSRIVKYLHPLHLVQYGASASCPVAVSCPNALKMILQPSQTRLKFMQTKLRKRNKNTKQLRSPVRTKFAMTTPKATNLTLVLIPISV